MGNARSSSFRRKVLRALTLSVALLAFSLTLGEAPAATSCASPPPVFPESSITPGMAGTGLTAVQGSTPVGFDIQVIGILPNALLPSFDLVIFKITGPPAFLDQAHGVASGMSGSPIYMGGQLAGAVSYTFGLAADPMIGLFTPAQQMVDLMALPTGTAATSLPSSVPVTQRSRVTVAEAARVPVSTVPTTVQQLAIPLGVSGLSDRRAQRLQSIIDQHGLPFHVYRAGGPASTSAATINPTPLEPGEPLAADLSTGDVTFAGIGTATFACGGLNVGWGHPFFFQGPSSLAMGGASVITVVNDVSGLFGPFKILIPTDLRGTVVQDRLAGLMGQTGAVPTAVPVTTTFTNTDNGKTRTGETDIFYQKAFWGPLIAYEHVFQNLLLVFDQRGKGTLSLSYTIRGLRGDGVTPFTVHNRNMVASDHAFQASYHLLNALYALAFNRTEKITFTSVESSGEITEQMLIGDIVRVRTASSLQRTLRDRPILKAKRGSRITLQVVLRPIGGGRPQTATFRMWVPHGANGFERISFRGGQLRQRINTSRLGFDRLLSILNDGEHPNDLIATGLGRRLIQEQDFVVRGQAPVTVRVVG